MALTKDIIKGTPGMEALTDSQIESLVKLSGNDETNVMTAYSRNFHDKLDATILEASGIPKDGSEKSYEYAARVAKTLKSATGDMIPKIEYEKLHSELETIKKTATDPDGWKQKADDAEKQLRKLQLDYKKAESKHLQEIHATKVGMAIEQSVNGLKFDDSVAEGLRKLAKEAAINKIKSYKADFDAEKDNRIIFRDENGEILTNPKNYQEPYSPIELLMKELEPYDVLAKGKPQTAGAGTQPTATGQTITTVSVTGAKNKTEALEIIRKDLASRGLTKASPEWAAEELKAYKENKVSELSDE